MSKFKLRGTWHHGIANQFVDVKALDIFLRILPWALAVEAVVRGWEFLRSTGAVRGLGFLPPTELRSQTGESTFGIEYFGLTFLAAGLVMFAGLLLRRFGPIILACLVGFASYSVLAASYITESILGDSGTGLRTGVTFLIIAGLWVFKGFFSATKKSVVDIQREAEALHGEVV